MTKYYRVRVQEQWNWLMKWFEEQDRNIRWYQTSELPTEFNYDDVDGDDIAVEEYEHEKLVYGDVDYYQNIEDVTDFIEVSQMMEDEKMEGYVTIDAGNVEKLKNEEGDPLFCTTDKQHFVSSFIEGFECSEVNIPKSLLYPKVRMSIEEKKELDWLKEQHVQTLYDALDYIDEERADYGTVCNLFDAIYENRTLTEFDFIRAWVDPELIEIVEEPKYNIEVPETGGLLFYVKNHENCGVGTKSENNLSDQQFTEKEIIQRGLSKYTRVKAPKQES
jgi:hypothetical protein